jgi:hypothetical protein
MGEVQVRGPFITGAYHEVGASPIAPRISSRAGASGSAAWHWRMR